MSAASGTAAALSWRDLTSSDLDAVHILHRRAIGEAVRPEVVKPETRDFFAGILDGRGRIVGAFAASGALAAYGVLQHALPAYDDPRPLIGAPADTPLAKLAGASVAPEFRGARLQRALIAARVARAGQHALMYATSSPANPPSWINLLAEGFAIRALVPYYGGHLRYVVVHHGAGGADQEGRLVDPQDIETQTVLLAQGWRGVAVRPGTSGRSILYVPGGHVSGAPASDVTP